MIITNEISEASVNIKATEEISAIFVLQVELKRKEYDDKNIIMISKLFGQKLRKQITDLELKARKEVQSKKKFEMVQRIQRYKERLKGI